MNEFQLQHGKHYESETEELIRLNIFVENKNKIAKHNQKYEKGLVSYKMGVNKYADMSHSEFVKIMNGLKKNVMRADNKKQSVSSASADVKVPETVDWRLKGAVTEVKDQGECGSCWSFSATGSLEGQHFRKSGFLVELSEQNLVDCSTSFGNNGCNGGLMDNAFAYIKANGGIDTEKSYPYKGIDGTCSFNATTVGATDKGFADITSGDEEELKKAVAFIGPISVGIDASHYSFQFYTEGVYFESKCSSEDLDHGVLAVGYGTDESGQDYWLVKNSWGKSWGHNGYIKIARNKKNHCGIATDASYPLV